MKKKKNSERLEQRSCRLEKKPDSWRASQVPCKWRCCCCFVCLDQRSFSRHTDSHSPGYHPSIQPSILYLKQWGSTPNERRLKIQIKCRQGSHFQPRVSLKHETPSLLELLRTGLHFVYFHWLVGWLTVQSSEGAVAENIGKIHIYYNESLVWAETTTNHLRSYYLWGGHAESPAHKVPAEQQRIILIKLTISDP